MIICTKFGISAIFKSRVDCPFISIHYSQFIFGWQTPPVTILRTPFFCITPIVFSIRNTHYLSVSAIACNGKDNAHLACNHHNITNPFFALRSRSKVLNPSVARKRNKYQHQTTENLFHRILGFNFEYLPTNIATIFRKSKKFPVFSYLCTKQKCFI